MISRFFVTLATHFFADSKVDTPMRGWLMWLCRNGFALLFVGSVVVVWVVTVELIYSWVNEGHVWDKDVFKI